MSATRLQTPVATALLWRRDLDDHVAAVAGSPDRSAVAIGSLGGDAVVLDAATGEVLALLPEHPGGVLSLAWSPDSCLLAVGGQDGEVALWDRATGGHARLRLNGWVGACGFSPDGRHLGIGAGNRLWVYDTAHRLGDDPGGERPLGLTDRGRQPSTITAIAWAGRPTLLGVACYGGLRWFDPAATGEQPDRELPFKGSLLCVGVSRDGRWAASGNQDATIHLWKLWDRDELEMHGYPSKITAVSWDTRSRLLASNGASDVTVWDVSGAGPKGRTPASLRHHEELVVSLQFQHRGSLLASTDGIDVALWRPHLGRRPLHVWAPEPEGVAQLAWHTDDRTLLVAGETGACSSWTIERTR